MSVWHNLELKDYLPTGDATVLWAKLSNSGELLKLMVPSYIWKYVSGWSNYSGMVTSLKMTFRLLLLKSKLGWKNYNFSGENKMDNRGSKSAILKIIVVKEQRVDGSWPLKSHLRGLRCTLKGSEGIEVLTSVSTLRVEILMSKSHLSNSI